ncbi:MAG TPA: hypothetical protein VFJ59_14735 [Pseudolabrys sp.]|jgi:hypothetical protein|nr:hypothetical protein [Pseudolabrys sp.]
MVTRTKRVTMTFQHPFSLKGVDRRLAPGDYEVVTDEELIEELSFPVYRRVATMILLPADARQSSIEMVTVEPADLAAAHERDSAASPSANPATKPRAP